MEIGIYKEQLLAASFWQIVEIVFRIEQRLPLEMKFKSVLKSASSQQLEASL